MGAILPAEPGELSDVQRLDTAVPSWLAILFTLTVLVNFATITRGTPPAWITYSPLLPLLLLLFTGVYMLALPYAAKRRRDV